MAVNNNFVANNAIATTFSRQQSATSLHTDILWRNASTGSNVVWLMNGITHEAGLNINSSSSQWQIAATADFNQDSQDDILWRNSLTGENAIWVMSNASTLEQEVGLYTVSNQNWQIEATADFNGDGQIDIFWRDSQTGENAIWFMNGTGFGSSLWSYRVADINWQIEATADFNLDGKADLLWHNSQTGENAIWCMDGTDIINGSWLYQTDLSWQIEAAVDFTHDGITDILWRNSDTGENAIWSMDGVNVASGIWLDRIADTNWQIESTADFNGDGSLDILWRNYSTGQNSIWNMDGTALTENILLTAIADTNWQIVGTIQHNTLEANNTLDTAANLGILNGLETITNRVEWIYDRNDFYRFTINSADTVRLNLSGLSEDVDIQLLNANGTVIDYSDFSGLTDEFIFAQLEAGSYYIRVNSYFSDSNYTLNISSGLGNFSETYGYGLVNAYAAVTRALGENIAYGNGNDWWNYTGGNWGNDAIDAPETWSYGYTGADITVAVIDDGLDIYHSDLNQNIWRNSGEIAGNGIDDDGNGYTDDIYGWNFTTGFYGNNGNLDPGIGSHGTHVAGTISGINNRFGITGVAYESHIMGLKIGDIDYGSNLFLNTGSLAEAIIYAVDNGARVINMSLSWPEDISIREALAYAASKNVITVMAAGNYSDREPTYPASYATEYGISVGAINEFSYITDFSNQAGDNSNMFHVVAPGESIYSTTPNNNYDYNRGTSMAAPHVAGIVALMLDANPHLSHAQVRQIIAETAY